MVTMIFSFTSEDNPVWDEPAATQPAPVTTPPVHKPPQDRALRQRSTSSSSIGKSEQVDPNMIFRKTTSGSSIVYRKNSASYSISRDCKCASSPAHLLI